MTITHAKVSSGTVDDGVEVDLSDWNADHVHTGQWTVTEGGTGANLSSTGGAAQFVKQSSTGAALSVGTIGASDLPTSTIRKPASAATITLTTADIEVGVDTRSTAVTVNLPGVVAWAAANPSAQLLTILDYYGNAGTNNVTPAVNGADSFNWGGITPKILSNYGIIRLRPDAAATTWMIYQAS